jgi:hypothetical protein
MNVAREQGIHDRTLRHKWDQFVAERKKDIDEATVLIWCDMEHRGGHNSGLSLNNQLHGAARRAGCCGCGWCSGS